MSDLMPGVQYFFVVYTMSYDLVSDISNLTTRTSECIAFLRHFIDEKNLVSVSVIFHKLFDSSLTNFASVLIDVFVFLYY